MLIAVKNRIILEVTDENQAEQASSLIDRGLQHQIVEFPEGEVVSVDVESWEKVTDEEAEEKGWVE